MTYTHHEAMQQLLGCRERLRASMKLSQEAGAETLALAELECLRATDEAMQLLARLQELQRDWEARRDFK